MIADLFIPFSICKIFKQKGFAGECLGEFKDYGKGAPYLYLRKVYAQDFNPNNALAVTYDQAIEFLVSKKIFIGVVPVDDWDSWMFRVYMEDAMAPMCEAGEYKEEFKTRRLALDAALIEAVKHLRDV